MSVVRGLVDLLSYQNLCTVELWFVRYELVPKGDRIYDFSVDIWHTSCYIVVVVVIVDAKCIMVNVLLLV